MKNFGINITGQVQGVGFRPHVYRLALAHKLCGSVSNDSKGVHIRIQSEIENVNRFVSDLLNNPPAQSKIESYEIKEVEDQYFDTFKIIESKNEGSKEVRLSPDFGLCDECKKDLNLKDDRRYNYAFTTCTNCGPRYSIIQNLPYDRPTTTMKDFHICPDCMKEYQDPMDRRFFSQTNSCPDCAIELELFMNGEKVKLDQSQIIYNCVKELEKGKIVAVKGIGGFLLLCDACNKKSIQNLRTKKQREDKPFALLYPDIKMVKDTYECSKEEVKLLEASSAPIVLMPLINKDHGSFCINEIAPGLDKIGVMLPYAPLLYLIAKDFGKALIATSGNINGSPIIYNNDQAIKELQRFADMVLIHNREITSPQDDSVIQYNSLLNAPVFYRRSRGFAPSYFGHLPTDFPKEHLALGAHLKASFALSTNNQVYISQYLGNLDSYEAQKEFKKTQNHLSSILDFFPKHILTDLHPNYYSNELGKRISSESKLPITYVQHHKAHFAAVLQENDLIDTNENVLGVIWDGTGYGEDDTIWGGEFFNYTNYDIKRVFHLKPFPIILADKMAKEPRLSALSLTHNLSEISDYSRGKFSQNEWAIYNQSCYNSKLRTSSIGRLFDAVASILGLINKSSYEGQAAMLLEAKAREFKGQTGPYLIEFENDQIEFESIIYNIIQDVKSNVNQDEIAFKFHLTLVKIMDLVARFMGIKKLAFSGGVFQNQLLVDLIILNLRDNYDLYFHKALSPNDECISFGQLTYRYIEMKSHSANLKSQSKTECYETSSGV